MEYSEKKITENSIRELDRRIENLKIQFNLFFAGELKVPPDKERDEIEKSIRKILSYTGKSSKIKLLTQNLSLKFSLYNNMWLKKLNENELGLPFIKKQKILKTGYTSPEKKSPFSLPQGHSAKVSLNEEESFERFYDLLKKFSPEKLKNQKEKEKIINSLKSQMIFKNYIDAEVKLKLTRGKIKIILKK